MRGTKAKAMRPLARKPGRKHGGNDTPERERQENVPSAADVKAERSSADRKERGY